MEIPRIKIPEEVYEQAKSWNERFKPNDNTIHKRDQLNHWVAEIMFQLYHKEAARTSEYGYDFDYKGLRLDVKNITRNVYVRDVYDCEVQQHQINYNNDAYFFTSINNKTREIEFIGLMKKADFLSNMKHIPAGSMMGNGELSINPRNVVNVATVLKYRINP